VGASATAEGADDVLSPKVVGGAAVVAETDVDGTETGALEAAGWTERFADGAGAGFDGAADDGTGAAVGAAGAETEGLAVLVGFGVGVAEGSHWPSGTTITGPQGSAAAGAATARAVKAVMAATARAGPLPKNLLRVLILDILRSTVRRLGDFQKTPARPGHAKT